MTDNVYPTGVFCAALTPVNADLSPESQSFCAALSASPR